MNKQPERTARTKRNLADAFWSTAEEKGIRRVTVSDVTKSAGLNRGTFYEYYTDIPSLTEEAEEEILSELRQQMKTALAALGQNDPQSILARGLEIFSRYDSRIFLLLGEKGDPNFRRKLQREAASILSETGSGTEKLLDQDYVIAFISSAFIGVLQYWHESGRPIGVEKLLGILQRLGFTGLQGYAGRTTETPHPFPENGV